MNSVIYQILNKKNGKSYIGSSSQYNERKTTHLTSLRKNKHENKFLQNSWNKYGENNFKFIILESFENIDRNKLYEIENNYVQKLKTMNCNHGYNIANPANKPPNCKGRILTLEHRQKISRANKGKRTGKKLSEETRRKIGLKSKLIPRTEEWCKKISLSRIGSKNPNWGGLHSWNKGMKGKYKISDEHKRKIGIASKGHILSAESRKKISESRYKNQNSISKLSKEDVLFIREYFKTNKKYKPLLLKFKISAGTLCDIKKYRTWNHI